MVQTQVFVLRTQMQSSQLCRDLAASSVRYPTTEFIVILNGLCHICPRSQTVELAARSKEVTAATSKREQLESLLEKAEGSQVVSTDLQNQVPTALNTALENVISVRSTLSLLRLKHDTILRRDPHDSANLLLGLFTVESFMFQVL